MAFGDLTEVEADESGAYTFTITSTAFSSGTPASTDLTVALHFAADATSNVDTGGFTEDQLATDSGNSDEGAIYSDLGATTVTCSSPSEDAHMLLFAWIEGPFESTPKDVSDESGPDTSSPTATGASIGSTAQADEVMLALETARIPTDNTNDWVRQGTATPTSAMSSLHDGIAETIDNSKRLEGAYQVLTGAGTVGVQRAHAGADGEARMLAYSTYKKEAVAGGNAPTSILQGPLVGPLGGPI